MNKIKVNGKQYIALGDFNHLRRNMVKDIYDRYEPDKNGMICLSKRDVGAVDALCHIMTEIMHDEIMDADSPEEIRELHRKIEREFLYHNFMIVTKDAETGEDVYFRMFCDHVSDDEETPVFTDIARLAKTWGDHYEATCAAEHLKAILDGDKNIRVVPVWMHMLPETSAERRLMAAIYGPDEPEQDEPETEREADRCAENLEKARETLMRAREALERAETALHKFEGATEGPRKATRMVNNSDE